MKVGTAMYTVHRSNNHRTTNCILKKKSSLNETKMVLYRPRRNERRSLKLFCSIVTSWGI